MPIIPEDKLLEIKDAASLEELCRVGTAHQKVHRRGACETRIFTGSSICHPEPKAKGLDSSPPAVAQNDRK